MNEKQITDLLAIVTDMAKKIKSLCAWREEVTKRQEAADAESQAGLTEFENWLSDRRKNEAQEAEDAARLKEMMI